MSALRIRALAAGESASAREAEELLLAAALRPGGSAPVPPPPPDPPAETFYVTDQSGNILTDESANRITNS